MKSYACYPGIRTRFQPIRSSFRNPGASNVSFIPGRDTKNNTPSTNIIRKDGAYEIQMAIPGISKDKVRIEVKEDQLVVSATPENNESQKPKFIRNEYDYTEFKRTFRLQKNANTSALTASFNQGILTIVIPDKEPETVKIDIQ